MADMSNIERNNTLQGFSNPMNNLLSTMKQITMNMGAVQYIKVLQELGRAEEHLHTALREAQKITYKLE